MVEYEGETFNFPKGLLPKNAKEGDVLKLSISVDKKATLERKKSIENLMDELFED